MRARCVGDDPQLEGLAVEIARQDEGAIFPHLVPGESEEGVLGLEIADLQGAVDLGAEAGATVGQGQFRFVQRQIVQPLPVIEIRQAVEGELLSLGQDGQELVFRRHQGSALQPGEYFPYKGSFRESSGSRGELK